MVENVNQQEEAKKLAESILNSTNELEKRAYGAVLGAFVADSLGSFHEFSSHVSEELIEQVMKQPGGGTFNLKKGQITDDSELALSMAYGLVEGGDKFSGDLIAKYYGMWYQSPPFDLGNTIGGALQAVGDNPINKLWTQEECQNKQLYQKIFNSAQHYNQGSQSNGCLMRISPLILYGLHLESQEQLLQVVEEEVKLTHCQQIVIEACKTYVLAGVELVRTGDASKAYEKAKDYVEKNCSEELKKQWWDEYVEKDQWLPATVKSGWSKIAWTYTFHYLRDWNEKYKNKADQAYKQIIREVLKRGGDTDTNGCIVGTFIGALVGFNNIPQLYRENFLNCDVTQGPVSRNERYAPWQILHLAKKLLSLVK